jgi:hypothetical protein
VILASLSTSFCCGLCDLFVVNGGAGVDFWTRAVCIMDVVVSAYGMIMRNGRKEETVF